MCHRPSALVECYWLPLWEPHIFRLSSGLWPVLERGLTFTSTEMRHWTTEMCSGNCVVRRFRRCANVMECKLDVHGSVHHNADLTEMTNKMQLCRKIYYSHYSLTVQHVSSYIIAHHQELLNCNYSFCFYSRPLSWLSGSSHSAMTATGNDKLE